MRAVLLIPTSPSDKAPHHEVYVEDAEHLVDGHVVALTNRHTRTRAWYVLKRKGTTLHVHKSESDLPFAHLKAVPIWTATEVPFEDVDAPERASAASV